MFLKLASVAFLSASLLLAQTATTIVCSLTAQPFTLRAEGIAENTGDLVLWCAGGTVPTVGSPLATMTLTVRLDVDITSRTVSEPLTEVLLFIDDPQPGSQIPCAGPNGICAPFSAGVGGAAMDTSGIKRNVFQGVRQNANTIAFSGIPVHPPGPTNSRIFRIKNIRAAAARGIPGSYVYASVAIQNGPSNLQLQHPTVLVGVLQKGILTDVRSRNGGDLDAASPNSILCSNVRAGTPTSRRRIRRVTRAPTPFPVDEASRSGSGKVSRVLSRRGM